MEKQRDNLKIPEIGENPSLKAKIQEILERI